MKHIAIFVSESAWAGSITLTLEILKTALAFDSRREPAYAIDLVGLDGQPVKTYGNISITPDMPLSQASEQYDAILLPTVWGIDSAYLAKHSVLYPWLTQQHRTGALVFGLLTGSYLMAEAGLLDHRIATTHWHFAEDFRRRYPKVRLQAEQMQTVENRLYCGGGVNAAMDLSIHLIKTFCGMNIAQLCERHCMMGTRRDYQKLTVDMVGAKQHFDERILNIQNWIETHYAEPVGLAEITARFGFSTRNLTRRFKQATGKSLQIYIQQYRLEIAKTLLENSQHSIQEICFNVGYESLTVFGRRFKAYTGVSASQYREAQKISRC